MVEGSTQKRAKSIADELREAVSVAVEAFGKTTNTTTAVGDNSNHGSGASNHPNDKQQLLEVLRSLKLAPYMVVQVLDAIKADVELFMFMNTDERMELIAARLGKPREIVFPS